MEGNAVAAFVRKWTGGTPSVVQLTSYDASYGLHALRFENVARRDGRERRSRFREKVDGWNAYLKVGQTNSICRVGIVGLEGDKTTWIPLPGDPRNHYVARLHWLKKSNELQIQQLNRLQNTNRIFRYQPGTKKLSPLFREHDKAWVDIHDEMFWLPGSQRFTWISDRNGWRQVFICSADGKQQQLVTPGKFDVVRLLHADDSRLSMFAYPNRSHSIREGKNTTRHLRRMMTRFLLEKLPAGGR